MQEGLLHHGPRGRMRLSIGIGWADGNDRGSAGIGHWRQTGTAVPVAAARRSRRMFAGQARKLSGRSTFAALGGEGTCTRGA